MKGKLHMKTDIKSQRTITVFEQEYYLSIWIEAFLTDRKVQSLAPGTIRFYRIKLATFLDFCDSQLITQIDQITPDNIRHFMLFLEARGNKPGGVHAFYRALRAFLFWWENEIEPEGWKNPIRKVKAPKVDLQPLEPVELDTVKALLATCDKSMMGDRDTAIFLALMDTGARAQEFLSIDLADVNMVTGSILIRCGKGGKPRQVYLGRKTRKAVRRYLSRRCDDSMALWVTQSGERMEYNGLRSMVRRRSEIAGVEQPGLHDFRRFFALAMLRNGTDIFTLQKLMGHADLQVLRRYLAQSDKDTIEAHRRNGPVDNANL
jgi:site-specific recombinase XerD